MKLILSGSSNVELARKISKNSGIPLAKAEITTFPCSETRVRIKTDLKGKDVFILQSLSEPANKHFVELLLLTDAARRMSCRKITTIIPWLGYSPQDKIFRKGEPLSSDVVIKALESIGTDKFILLDLHSQKVLDLFSKSTVETSALLLFIEHLKSKIDRDWVVASLDKGSRARSEKFAKLLNIKLVKFDKTRDRKTGEVTFHNLNGNVKNKSVIAIDDYVSTGGTLIKSADYLQNKGAKRYWCCITHIIVKETLNLIKRSSIEKFITTNSIPLSRNSKENWIDVLDVSSLIAKNM